MPEIGKELLNYGVLGILASIVLWKVLPWGERWIRSAEKLHITLADKITSQQVMCDNHGETAASTYSTIRLHSNAMRSACAMCRDVAAKEFPNSSAKVNEHCAEIERIISEA